jgi:hypothetical protein
MKTCNICSETKPLADYYYQVGKPMRRCKSCQCAYARAWAELSKDKMLATRAKYKDSKYRTKVVREDRAAQRFANADRAT